jgi:hypothetical protein
MAWHWSVLIGVWCSLALVLMGCAPSAPRGGQVAADVYRANPLAVVANGASPLQVINDVGGEIVIVTGKDDEVAADVIATGTGGSLEQGRIEAESHIALLHTPTEVHVYPIADSNGKNMDAQDRALLHVRVPANISLPKVFTRAGDIGIFGDVGDVTAVISTSGNINVRGANGNVNLLTEKGSITADVVPDKTIIAHAHEGGIDLLGVNTVVSAITTQGNIRFLGSLRSGNSNNFVTTKTGDVAIGIPAYVKDQSDKQLLRVYASTSTSPIIVDYPPNRQNDSGPLTICGVIHSAGPYDYHIENTTARFGRIEVSPAPTVTYYFSGTLTATYYRFDTDQSRISIFAPTSQSIHIYTDADLNRLIANPASVDPDCRVAFTPPNDVPVINLKVSAETGRIFIHHISMPPR